MGKHDPEYADVILAAGGVVWRQGARGEEIAVIHRPRHNDWTLPKGKLDAKERWQEAALREVEEETGFDVELGAFAGSCAYMTRSSPKVVLYWHMRLTGEARFEPDDRHEVDELAWLLPGAALTRLSHDRERRFLREAIAERLGIETERRVVKPGLADERPPETPQTLPGFAPREAAEQAVLADAGSTAGRTPEVASPERGGATASSPAVHGVPPGAPVPSTVPRGAPQPTEPAPRIAPLPAPHRSEAPARTASEVEPAHSRRGFFTRLAGSLIRRTGG